MRTKNEVRHRHHQSSENKVQTSRKISAKKEKSGLQFLMQLAIVILIAVVAYLSHAYITSPISAKHVRDIHDVLELKWTKVTNNDLQRGEKILMDLKGPESIAVDEKGNWYTGLADGRIVKISNAGKRNQKVVDITASLDYARGNKKTDKRPIGIRIKNSRIYFADAFQGVFMIDMESNTWEKIVAYDDVSPSMAFPDDLTITADEKTIYFTDASHRWGPDHVAFSAMENECSGRIFKVDLETKKIDLIYRELCFPNGIELDGSENKILVSENFRLRVHVIDIKSKSIVKTINLPGGPDNIRRGKSGYWVAVGRLTDPKTEATFYHPVIRNILTTILGEAGLYNLVDLGKGIAVKLDKNFAPISIHYDMEGKVSKAISEVSQLDNGELLLGSFIASGIAKIDKIGVA